MSGIYLSYTYIITFMQVPDEGEHEVELLLNRKTTRGVTRYLVRWRGHTSAEDEWLRAEELLHCPEKVISKLGST